MLSGITCSESGYLRKYSRATCICADRVSLPVQGSGKEVPKLFNPAEEYNDKAVLLVTLASKTITLTAKEVTGMPWPQFVRLMKVRSSIDVPCLAEQSANVNIALLSLILADSDVPVCSSAISALQSTFA